VGSTFSGKSCTGGKASIIASCSNTYCTIGSDGKGTAWVCPADLTGPIANRYYWWSNNKCVNKAGTPKNPVQVAC
jgi:hypothetical protein